MHAGEVRRQGALISRRSALGAGSIAVAHRARAARRLDGLPPRRDRAAMRPTRPCPWCDSTQFCVIDEAHVEMISNAKHGWGNVLDVRFEVEGCKGSDIDGVRLERVTATGLAVRFAQAA